MYQRGVIMVMVWMVIGLGMVVFGHILVSLVGVF